MQKHHHIHAFRVAGILAAVLCALLLSGCGSTKVYTADKTLVYKDSLYNLSSVRTFSSAIRTREGTNPPVDVRNTDKKGWGEITSGGPVQVESVIVMDDQELVYERRTISRWSDFDRMRKNIDRASRDISKFMADKKKTQLKLK